MGDVRPIAQVWDLARDWYGRHLDASWKKWSAEEAIFRRHALDGPIWEMPLSQDRF
jgi:hypothetical protein